MRQTRKRFQKFRPTAIVILKLVDKNQMLVLALANVPTTITVFIDNRLTRIAAQRH